MANIIKTRGRTTPRPTSENRSFQLCCFHSDAHPVTKCKDQCPHSLLAARNGDHTRDQNRYDPRYGSTKDSGNVPSALWYSVRQGTNSWVAICTKSTG
ncbi:hypothetical protein TNIN_31371 [Trichonephila inaurata madagascariensis]|uniref:Uncharacterized protein n=1 Tax=Trichonephila inaurata madagascariensis TaxID=2747483 RepID=A0A8X7BPP9_9ARAC|nr:hypothetical protein TNIN_31371 [Trichonephila inaurata madagascariensis]